MHAYTVRTVDPPRIPAHRELLAKLRAATGARRVKVLDSARVDVNAVLADEEYIEGNHLNDSSCEWIYEHTTALHEADRAGDSVAVRALLDRDAFATRYLTLADHSTATFKHTLVEYRLPRDAWTRRTSESTAAARREIAAALSGSLGTPADRARALVCGLFEAVQRGDAPAIGRTLAAGADPTLGGPGGTTAIGLALVLGDLAALHQLLGASPDGLVQDCAWTLPSIGGALDLYPIAPLQAAATLCNRAAVALLLDRGADPAVGWPRSCALVHHLARVRYVGEPDVALVQLLGAATLRRLHDTIGEVAVREELHAPWNDYVLDALRAAGVVR